jgi:hypothetical protein
VTGAFVESEHEPTATTISASGKSVRNRIEPEIRATVGSLR